MQQLNQNIVFKKRLDHRHTVYGCYQASPLYLIQSNLVKTSIIYLVKDLPIAGSFVFALHRVYCLADEFL